MYVLSWCADVPPHLPSHTPPTTATATPTVTATSVPIVPLALSSLSPVSEFKFVSLSSTNISLCSFGGLYFNKSLLGCSERDSHEAKWARLVPAVMKVSPGLISHFKSREKCGLILADADKFNDKPLLLRFGSSRWNNVQFKKAHEHTNHIQTSFWWSEKAIGSQPKGCERVFVLTCKKIFEESAITIVHINHEISEWVHNTTNTISQNELPHHHHHRQNELTNFQFRNFQFVLVPSSEPVKFQPIGATQ